MKAIIVLATAIAAVNACTPVTLYQKNVHSESKPKGQINAIMITGAATGGTGGGSPTAEERCAYLYNPDIKAGSSTPKYKGDNWPYFRVGEGCNFVLDKSIPTGSKLREPGFVSIGANRALLIGGLPVYQYDDDEVGVCYCNQPPDWTSIDANGKGAAFPVTYPN